MKYILSFLLMFFFLGCENNTEQSGMARMHWDRDMCDRCVMVISDRKNSIQLRGKTKKQNHKFDDIGCMVIWLKEEKISVDKVDIWVTDVVSGDWIEAKSAFYTTGNTTPMAYGYSAHKSKQNIDKDREIVSFDDIFKQIKE